MDAQLHERGGRIETRGDAERGRLAGAVVLIGSGLILFAGQVFTLGAWPLLMLGVLFTAASGLTHTAGWLIPGGLLNGIWLGATLSESALATGDSAEGGLFLLGFAAGWASIALLAPLLAGRQVRWALIPAGVMALIGTPLLFGPAGEAMLDTALGWTSLLWPVALIVAGALLLRRARQ